MATLAEMMVSIGADTSGLESGLSNAQGTLKSFGDGMKNVGKK